MHVPIFDGHNDVLSRLHRRGGDAVAAFLSGDEAAHLDLPRAVQGGFSGGLFAIFVSPPKAPAADADAGAPPALPTLELAQAQQSVCAQLSLLLRIERESHGRVRVCRDADDLDSCITAGVLGAVVHIEGAEAVDPDFAFLDVLYAAGLRSLGPVWSRPNAFGYGVPLRCPSSPDIGPGLTPLGKELIRACNRLGILVDVSHLNERGFWDVAAISSAPIVATHSNAHALSPHARNLTDAQLAAVRDSAGMVGVNFGTAFLRADGRKDPDTPVELIIDHAAYLLDRLGEDGVGLGSDFDGTTIPAGIGTAGELQRLVDLMRARSFGEPLIEKLCFRNWLRVLRQTWQRAGWAGAEGA